MSDPKRVFKGVWIPAEIWLNPTLTWMEKCLYAEINSLDDPEDGCTASNDYLGKMLGTSGARIANSISTLRAGGYVTTASFDGRTRVLRVNPALTPGLRQGLPLGYSPIIQGKGKSSGEPAADQTQAAVTIYNLYPKKVAKPVAIAAIVKQLKKFPAADLESATRKFAAAWEGAPREEMRFCPMPATWFNQERFNDDPDTWKRAEQNGHSKPFVQAI